MLRTAAPAGFRRPVENRTFCYFDRQTDCILTDPSPIHNSRLPLPHTCDWSVSFPKPNYRTRAEAARCLDLPHLQAPALLASGDPPDPPEAATASVSVSFGGSGFVAEEGRCCCCRCRVRIRSGTVVPSAPPGGGAGQCRGGVHLRVQRRKRFALR